MMISPHPQSLSSIMGLRSSMNKTSSSKFLLQDIKVPVHEKILPWQQRRKIMQCTFSVSVTLELRSTFTYTVKFWKHMCHTAWTKEFN